jgi:hypothetical protein
MHTGDGPQWEEAYKMSGSDPAIKLKATATKIVQRSLPRDEANQAVRIADLPATLYLHVDGNVEWSLFTGHAWGRAKVSTDPDGAQPFEVDNLKLQIIMDTPEQQNKTNEGHHVEHVDNDVVYGSTFNPIFSGPHSVFVATATHSGFGTWSNSTSVY